MAVGACIRGWHPIMIDARLRKQYYQNMVLILAIERCTTNDINLCFGLNYLMLKIYE